MPEIFGGDEAIAFTVFALIGTSISLVASLASGRWLPRRFVDELPGLSVAASALLGAAGLGLATLAVTDDEATAERDLEVRYVFEPASGTPPLPDVFVTLLASLDPGRPELPSISADVPAASWHEREAQDLLEQPPGPGEVPSAHGGHAHLVVRPVDGACFGIFHDHWRFAHGRGAIQRGQVYGKAVLLHCQLLPYLARSSLKDQLLSRRIQ